MVLSIYDFVMVHSLKCNASVLHVDAVDCTARQRDVTSRVICELGVLLGIRARGARRERLCVCVCARARAHALPSSHRFPVSLAAKNFVTQHSNRLKSASNGPWLSVRGAFFRIERLNGATVLSTPRETGRPPTFSTPLPFGLCPAPLPPYNFYALLR